LGRNELFLDLHPKRGLKAGQRWLEASKAATNRLRAEKRAGELLAEMKKNKGARYLEQSASGAVVRRYRTAAAKALRPRGHEIAALALAAAGCAPEEEAGEKISQAKEKTASLRGQRCQSGEGEKRHSDRYTDTRD
jgi:predicted SprT family Zn-dependent metalloprotease